MEWNVDWRRLNAASFFATGMSPSERKAGAVFASFHPNGYIREQAVRLMQGFDGTLPYILLRINDWVAQVRQAATEAFEYRMRNLSAGQIIEALSFAEKLRWSGRGLHGELTRYFFESLTNPQHKPDLLDGLKSKNIRTRRICVNALADNREQNLDLLNQLLTSEPDPFLRRVIFFSLSTSGQDMGETSMLMIRDKCAANRLLAIQYVYLYRPDRYFDVLKDLLMDKNAAIRGIAVDNIERYYDADFDFRAAYLSRLCDKTAIAILGLGEKGEKADVSTIEPYLDDQGVAVTKAAMTATMKLDEPRFSRRILDMLDDARPGVSKTARRLTAKLGDYSRVHEIFHSTEYDHTKINCAAILFFASKWQSIIYMLKALTNESESVRNLAMLAILRWLSVFNRSYDTPTEPQKKAVSEMIGRLGDELPPKLKRELLFLGK